MWLKTVASLTHLFNERAPIPLQRTLQMPDILIHHPQASGVVPAQPLFQKLALVDHLASPAGQVDEQRVLAVREHKRAVG
jgi:hypothetical protein